MRQIVAIEDNCPPKDKWLRVEWNLGRRCNYDCSYCGTNLHNNTSEHMTVDVFSRTIDTLISTGQEQQKKVKIALTGGEPFVNPNILQMLQYAKDSGIFKISVTTNGSVPLKKYQQALEFIDYFIISYHFEFGYHERIINTIVGLDRLCKEHGGGKSNKKMHVHLMFLPGHLSECKEIINILTTHGVTYAVRRIRPQFDPNTKQYLLPYASGMTGLLEQAATSELLPYYSSEELDWLATV